MRNNRVFRECTPLDVLSGGVGVLCHSKHTDDNFIFYFLWHDQQPSGRVGILASFSTFSLLFVGISGFVLTAKQQVS